MLSEPNTVVKHLQQQNHWQLCRIIDGKKEFFGWSDVSGGKWVKYLANKLENCTDGATVANEIRTSKIKSIATYYITEDDVIVGIDIDKIQDGITFNIPFPVVSYFVEQSPSGTGCHIWCLVEPEVKSALLNLYNRKIVFDNDVDFADHVEYRMASCLLTVTGRPYPNITITQSSTIQHLKSKYRETVASIEAIKSIVMDCMTASTIFKQAVENSYSKEELERYEIEGISELLFSLARVIHQRTGSTDPDLYYRILSRLEIVKLNNKWMGKEHKLKRWCEDNTTFEAIDRADNEKALLISNLSEKEIDDTISSPQSLIIDPKAPEGVLVPLFYKAYESLLYPTSVGIYRYSEQQRVYIKYTKAEVVAFAEDFYRKLLPQKSVTSIYALASASVRYVYNVYAECLSLSFPHTPELLGDKSNHLYMHLDDAIYDVEANEFLEETPRLLSTYKLSVDKQLLQSCFSNYYDNYQSSNWRAFLESSFNRDLETIESLQRFFGYVISKDFDKQKALVLRGEAGSGKGTLISVISDVLNASIASTSMQQMDEKFGYSTCIDKQLLVFPEMPRNMRKYHGAWERLKALISADPVSVELKGQQAFSTVLHTKVIICTNYDLSYDGDMNSLNRRLVYCTLPQSFGGVKSLEIDYRSLLSTPTEHAVILAWIIEGYKLYKATGLMQSNIGSVALEDATEETDLILDFIKQELVKGEMTDVVRNSELKTAFKRFCDTSDVSQTFRPSTRMLPTKIKSHVAKNWFNVPTTELDYRSSLDRGIKGVKFKNLHNYDDLSDCPF